MLSISNSLVLILLSSSLITFFYFILISPFAFIFYLRSYLVTLFLLCGLPGLECSILTALLGLAGLPPFCLFLGKVARACFSSSCPFGFVLMFEGFLFASLLVVPRMPSFSSALLPCRRVPTDNLLWAHIFFFYKLVTYSLQ